MKGGVEVERVGAWLPRRLSRKARALSKGDSSPSLRVSGGLGLGKDRARRANACVRGAQQIGSAGR